VVGTVFEVTDLQRCRCTPAQRHVQDGVGVSNAGAILPPLPMAPGSTNLWTS
jgi:hypothetical protein